MSTLCTRVVHIVKNGGIAVVPTDTLYGIVARAEDPRAVERVYRTRGRDEKKPCIVLIAERSDLARFGVAISEAQDTFLRSVWPGKVSVIVPCMGEQFIHVHRGGGTVAFRLPAHEALRALLRETGPLIAPSANPEGKPPAQTIAEARAYFKENVDSYCDGGTLVGPASSVVSLVGEDPVVIRA